MKQRQIKTALTFSALLLTPVFTHSLSDVFNESLAQAKHQLQRADQPRQDYYTMQVEQLTALAKSAPKEEQAKLSTFILDAFYDRMGWTLAYAQRVTKEDESVYSKHNLFYTFYQDTKKFMGGWFSSSPLTADHEAKLKELNKQARLCCKAARNANSSKVLPQFLRGKTNTLIEQMRVVRKDPVTQIYYGRHEQVFAFIDTTHRARRSKAQPNLTKFVSDLSALPRRSIDLQRLVAEVTKFSDAWQTAFLKEWEQLYPSHERVKVALHGMISSKPA